MSDHEADARARLATKEGRIEAITQRAYSRRFGSGNSNYIRECADDEYELLGFLAAAEARVERLAAALEWYADEKNWEFEEWDWKERMLVGGADKHPGESVFVTEANKDAGDRAYAALTDPATDTEMSS